jgi:Fe-S-cluster containining protein
MNESPQGYLAYIRKQQEVFIPFVCKRCGECCRKVSVRPHEINFRQVAKYLNVSRKEIAEKYLAITTAADGETVHRKPCPFLKGNDCAIYPVRPSPCKGYPVFTDFGTRGIVCMSDQEVRRAEKSIRICGSTSIHSGDLINPKILPKE